ncbi:flavodoxin family protein [Erysipelotrichaceae bacterium OttesenSCG-928-M19]|nr:flavodoxin family protein [Erysipelotrichaceae bacterium OttesenSCG-928-M19]
MKVLIINGSPNVNGNTFVGAKIISNVLKEHNIDSEIYSLGNKVFKPCTACRACFKNKDFKCVIHDDLNDLIEKCLVFDGLVLGSPIHFADVSGLIKNALDRLFYVSAANNNIFYHKVGAAYTVVRRSGGIAGFHTLNNYLMYAEMFIAGSSYWNVVHGQKPEEAYADKEGVQTLETLADNLAYLLKIIDTSTIEEPKRRPKVGTNFVREDLLTD